MVDESVRVVIADDEPLARDCIRLALRDEPGIEILAECADGAEAVAAIRELAPDLVFLDVQMPTLDGFGVVETIGPERMPPVVFVTAYDAHALRAFALHAVDYVLKPFDDRRFGDTLAHARLQLRRERESELGRRLAALLREFGPTQGRPAEPAPAYATRMLVRRGDRMKFVPTDDVDWFESAGNYVRLHTGGDTELVRGTLAGLAVQLDPTRFVRIHRSTIVNVSRIREVQPWFGGDYTATLVDGTELRVSRHYRDALLKPVS
jgi:two-component system LytT family response regulator